MKFTRTDAVPQPQKQLDIATVRGTYTIAAPEVSNGWDCGGPLTLSLEPSLSRSHLWGLFNFGAFEGKLRSCSTTRPKNNTIHFLWRGRETGEGESSYGDENIAEFIFLGNGKFTGKRYWDCLGTSDLVGKLRESGSRSGASSADIDDWKQVYWSLNDSNHERERVGRWGRGRYWRRDRSSGEESNSDTGNERGAHEQEENEESNGEETDNE